MSRVCPADLYVLEKLPPPTALLPTDTQEVHSRCTVPQAVGSSSPSDLCARLASDLAARVHGQDLLLVPARTFIAAIASVYSKVHMARGLRLDVSRYVH